MTTMKTNDDSQYVLVLTKEEAELLGTFRFSHVGGSTPLYEVLRDLPHKIGARFRTEVDPCSGKPIFHEMTPAGVAGLRRGEMPIQPIARPSGGKSLLEVLVLASLMSGAPIPQRTVTGRMRLSDVPMPDNLRRPLPDVLMDDQTARRVALTPEAQPKKWIVQYNDCISGGWISCVGTGYCANSEYTSRNEAYRQMRARIKKFGTQPDRYRVVPKGTAAWPERDRGYYTVEFFAKFSYPKGWRSTTSRFLSGTFSTAESARHAINTHVDGADRHRYRVKWHPSRT